MLDGTSVEIKEVILCAGSSPLCYYGFAKNNNEANKKECR